MVAVTALGPSQITNAHPIVMVHGAANSGLVWQYWQEHLGSLGWASYAIDLRGHGRSVPCDVSSVSMWDYAADVTSVLRQLQQPPILLGWSMGGLVSLMVATTEVVACCVAFAPSMPAQHLQAELPLRAGVFGPEEYGIAGRDPADQPAMPDLDEEERTLALASLSEESRFARDERQRGIVIERISCPLLVVTGTQDTQWPRERYDKLWLQASYLEIEGASHWGHVLNRRALNRAIGEIVTWVKKVI